MSAIISGGKAFVRRHGGGLMGSVTATTSPGVVLTFDDGPDPTQTPLVLAALRSHEATATFFVLLSRARAFPSLLAEIDAEGHEIALHGPDHRALTRYPVRQARERTAAARHELEDIAQRAVRWFRPPYGRQHPGTWLAVRQVGLTPVLWNGSTGDSQPLSPAQRRERIVSSARPGAIVLAHDGIAGVADGVSDPPPALADRAALAATALRVYREHGLRTTSLADALVEGASLVRTLELTQWGRERDARFL